VQVRIFSRRVIDGEFVMHKDERGFKPTERAHYYCLCEHFILAQGGRETLLSFESKGWEPDEVRFHYLAWRRTHKSRDFARFTACMLAGEAACDGRASQVPHERRTIVACAMPRARAVEIISELAGDADVFSIFRILGISPEAALHDYMVWCTGKRDADFKAFLEARKRDAASQETVVWQ
jgi:hypothetical protein